MKAQLESFGHVKGDFSPQRHETASLMKIIIQLQASAFSPRHAPLRPARCKDLPGFNIFKQQTDGFLSGHRYSYYLYHAQRDASADSQEREIKPLIKIPIGRHFLQRAKISGLGGGFDMGSKRWIFGVVDLQHNVEGFFDKLV
ncbi:MAG: hypothetical protein K9M60_00465 [Akkermansiaceae bacterium]|nr:hypothetical protein [Akkermansiaceae bacterium]